MTAASEIPQDILTELGFLHEQTSQVRGWTPLDDPRRALADDFCKLALRTMAEFGVSVWVLSRALGLSTSTLALKLGRHGHIPLPPSQTAYQGVGLGAGTRAKKAKCKRGHDTSSEGTRNSTGHCKECVLGRDRKNPYRSQDQLRQIPSYPNCATCDGGGCGDCA